MRLICFFDLPTETAEDRRAYRRFRKTLITNGFFMMQESVYCKMVLNQTAQQLIVNLLKKERPEKGFIQLLPITEKQFANMEYLVGESTNNVIDSDQRLIII